MTAYKANKRLSRDLGLVMRDAEDLLRATAGAASDKAGEVRRRLASALESARTSCGRLQDGTTRAAKATNGVIRAHPYESLGIALGTGLLIGALVARR
jgi:ElaB/YqjD/DUF883 family membrane-anchored ribosome-binding protein